MPLNLEFICPLPEGVHARPAGTLARAARNFAAHVTVTNTRTGKSGNGKNILAVLSTGIRQRDTCRLSVHGVDEAEAMTALARVVAQNFSGHNNLLAPAPPSPIRPDRMTDGSRPELITAEQICLDADCRTKTEALKLAVRLLETTGRTAQPSRLEKSIWKRERQSPTDFGGGFAIPHCRSVDLNVDSLVFLRLKQAVPWGTADAEPVRCVFLLAACSRPTSSASQQILPQLAALLLDKKFQSEAIRATDPCALGRVFAEGLRLNPIRCSD